MSTSVCLPARKTETATLMIGNFSQLDNSCCDKGFEINDHLLWFGFRPKTLIYDKYNEYASVYLLNRSNQETFNFRLKVSILNFDGDKVYTGEYCGAFDDKNKDISFTFMPLSEIAPKSGYLYYDVLILLFEIEMFDRGQKKADKQDLINLSADFETLLQNGKFRDATLVVGAGGKELHVHKTILAARSPVFAAMFEHDCEEKRQNKVIITDMDQEACEEMLRYIYTGKVQSLDRYEMDLLVAADKYQLESLKARCEQYILSSNLSIETVATVLILADMHRAVKLKTKCIDFISDNVTKMKDTEGWQILNSSKPQLLGEIVLHLASKTNR